MEVNSLNVTSTEVFVLGLYHFSMNLTFELRIRTELVNSPKTKPLWEIVETLSQIKFLTLIFKINIVFNVIHNSCQYGIYVS